MRASFRQSLKKQIAATLKKEEKDNDDNSDTLTARNKSSSSSNRKRSHSHNEGMVEQERKKCQERTQYYAQQAVECQAKLQEKQQEMNILRQQQAHHDEQQRNKDREAVSTIRMMKSYIEQLEAENTVFAAQHHNKTSSSFQDEAGGTTYLPSEHGLFRLDHHQKGSLRQMKESQLFGMIEIVETLEEERDDVCEQYHVLGDRLTVIQRQQLARKEQDKEMVATLRMTKDYVQLLESENHLLAGVVAMGSSLNDDDDDDDDDNNDGRHNHINVSSNSENHHEFKKVQFLQARLYELETANATLVDMCELQGEQKFLLQQENATLVSRIHEFQESEAEQLSLMEEGRYSNNTTGSEKKEDDEWLVKNNKTVIIPASKHCNNSPIQGAEIPPNHPTSHHCDPHNTMMIDIEDMVAVLESDLNEELDEMNNILQSQEVSITKLEKNLRKGSSALPREAEETRDTEPVVVLGHTQNKNHSQQEKHYNMEAYTHVQEEVDGYLEQLRHFEQKIVAKAYRQESLILDEQMELQDARLDILEGITNSLQRGFVRASRWKDILFLMSPPPERAEAEANTAPIIHTASASAAPYISSSSQILPTIQEESSFDVMEDDTSIKETRAMDNEKC